MTNNKHAEAIKVLLDHIRLLDQSRPPNRTTVTRQAYANKNIAAAVQMHSAIHALQASGSAAVPSLDLIRQAVARGWCSEENSHKEMDSVLALAISDEVLKLYTAPASAKPLPEAQDAIAQLVEAMETVLTISDRKHDAWDAAKAAIAAYRAAPQASGGTAVSAKPPWTTCPDCGYDIARASAKPLPLDRDKVREQIIAAIRPLACRSAEWRGWPGVWNFAEVAMQVMEAAYNNKEPA